MGADGLRSQFVISKTVGENRTMSGKRALVPAERIERRILSVRDEKVMLDEDLARLFGVETRVLVQAVRRNFERFPEDVPALGRGVPDFEVTICDLKEGPGWTTVSPLCLH
jgi:hypothetical protein